MARQRAVFEEGGLEFHFFFHEGSTGPLHITVRWGTLPQDAPEVFWRGERVYDERRDCWISRTASHELTWQWIDEGKTLFVISFLPR